MSKENIILKIKSNINLQYSDIEYLYYHLPLSELMYLAYEKRIEIHPNNKVSWQIDRNINIGNECIAGCKFCAFHTTYKADNAYTTKLSEYYEKIEEMLTLGGDQILLQGGLHPKYGLGFYTQLFQNLKAKFPHLKLHALGPPEIAHIARIEKTTYKTVLQQLMSAGLDSLPGAGAEILSDNVRKKLSPGKPNSNQWIEVMREAHALNLTTSATMVFGHIETIEERILNLLKIRDLQEESLSKGLSGFLAFILWNMHLNEKQKELPIFENFSGSSSFEYLRMVALSRIVLWNIPNIQTSWLSVGVPVAQLSLHGGANDMGSIMIEENVVSKVNQSSTTVTTPKILQQAIIDAGFEPWLRTQDYQPREYK